MTTPISEAKGVPPHEYSAHLERALQEAAKREADWRAWRRRQRRMRAAFIVAFTALVFLCVCWYIGGAR